MDERHKVGIGDSDLPAEPVPILFSLGYKLSGCLAGEEADKLYENRVMRGEGSVDGGHPLSDRCFCFSPMLVHDLARAHAVP